MSENVENLYSETARRTEPSALRELRKILREKDLINLASGEPSPESPAAKMIQQAVVESIEKVATDATGYGLTAGKQELRDAATQIVKAKGIDVSSEGVMLVNGSQRALDLVGRVMLDPGDVVLLEMPTYTGAIACFRNLGATFAPVEVDEEGIKPSDLEAAVDNAKSTGRKVKMLYTIPSFQNPTGTTLSQDRRKEIASIAERENFLIVEDDIYGEIWFEGGDTSPYRPIASLAPQHTVYINSFSKTVSPALRAAYMAGPEWLMQKVEHLAQAADLSAGTMDQMLVLSLLESGVLQESLKSARAHYREMCQVMVKSMDEFMPEGVTWNNPKGGFFLWVEVPDNITTVELLNAAVSREVSFLPGKVFYPVERGINRLRLSFARETKGRIRVGVASLATAIRFWDMKKKIPWALGDCC